MVFVIFSTVACQRPVTSSKPEIKATLVQPSLVSAPKLPILVSPPSVARKIMCIEVIVGPDGRTYGTKLISGSGDVFKQLATWLDKLDFKPGELHLSDEPEARKVHCRVVVYIDYSTKFSKFNFRFAGPDGRL
jgi:hypothetical protein